MCQDSRTQVFGNSLFSLSPYCFSFPHIILANIVTSAALSVLFLISYFLTFQLTDQFLLTGFVNHTPASDISVVQYKFKYEVFSRNGLGDLTGAGHCGDFCLRECPGSGNRQHMTKLLKFRSRFSCSWRQFSKKTELISKNNFLNATRTGVMIHGRIRRSPNRPANGSDPGTSGPSDFVLHLRYPL